MRRTFLLGWLCRAHVMLKKWKSDKTVRTRRDEETGTEPLLHVELKRRYFNFLVGPIVHSVLPILNRIICLWMRPHNGYSVPIRFLFLFLADFHLHNPIFNSWQFMASLVGRIASNGQAWSLTDVVFLHISVWQMYALLWPHALLKWHRIWTWKKKYFCIIFCFQIEMVSGVSGDNSG